MRKERLKLESTAVRARLRDKEIARIRKVEKDIYGSKETRSGRGRGITSGVARVGRAFAANTANIQSGGGFNFGTQPRKRSKKKKRSRSPSPFDFGS